MRAVGASLSRSSHPKCYHHQQVDQDQRKAFGYTGWSLDTASDNFDALYEPSPISDSPGFMECFGVFFTAVTGIVAGANLSGDLKGPSLN